MDNKLKLTRCFVYHNIVGILFKNIIEKKFIIKYGLHPAYNT